MSASQRSVRKMKNKEQNLVLTESVNALKGEYVRVKVQLKVRGTRLTDLEDNIERIKRMRRRDILVIGGLLEAEREHLGKGIDRR